MFQEAAIRTSQNRKLNGTSKRHMFILSCKWVSEKDHADVYSAARS
jgi:hypothetical protein